MAKFRDELLQESKQLEKSEIITGPKTPLVKSSIEIFRDNVKTVQNKPQFTKKQKVKKNIIKKGETIILTRVFVYISLFNKISYLLYQYYYKFIINDVTFRTQTILHVSKINYVIL